MCGRAKLPTDVSELKLDLKIDWDKLGDYQPRWNATPAERRSALLRSESIARGRTAPGRSRIAGRPRPDTGSSPA